MTVSVKTYMTNIIDILATVVLPSVNSAFARIQLSYAIDILNQLQNQVEYRTDVMGDDYEAAREIFDIARAALSENHIPMPEEIALFSEIPFSDKSSASGLTEALAQVETVSTRALDVMYEKSDALKNFNEVENTLLDLAVQYVRRKGKLKAPTINLELLESGAE